MLANYNPDWNIEDLTDAAVYAATHYLERDTSSANRQEDTPTTPNFDQGVVICLLIHCDASFPRAPVVVLLVMRHCPAMPMLSRIFFLTVLTLSTVPRWTV
jgi:hypothetical protein